MDRLAAVRFNNVGKYYYFSTRLDLHKGDKVVVETVRGLELGELISELKDMSEFKLETELKPVIRLANQADLEVDAFNKDRAVIAFDICKQIIAESGLDMHLINCEYTLDSSKIIFMYTADERVDFRELLKRLASEFKCRIELRQVGPRDKAKIIGGLGNCGMPLCCSSFLGEFDGISINMAKNQLLAINIDKISGACGRLLCCLKYEDEAYKEIKKKYPKIGTISTFNKRSVKVVGLNVLSELVKIDDQGNISFITLEEYNLGMPMEVLKEKAAKEAEAAADNKTKNKQKQKNAANRNQNKGKKPNQVKKVKTINKQVDVTSETPKIKKKQKPKKQVAEKVKEQQNPVDKQVKANKTGKKQIDKTKKKPISKNLGPKPQIEQVEKKVNSNQKKQSRNNKKRYFNNKRKPGAPKQAKGSQNGQQ
ncbi:MAG: stage 0 sporulation family protein [Erysipelotrichaceae bacterium]|nr:stage 0 sporulation family protein [Erysipelotrichaceae bacterium]